MSTGGASNDFSRATNELAARAMVTRFGMSEKLGVMVYDDSQQDRYFGGPAITISEATQPTVDAEIRSILDTRSTHCRAKMLEEKSR